MGVQFCFKLLQAASALVSERKRCVFSAFFAGAFEFDAACQEVSELWSVWLLDSTVVQTTQTLKC